MIREVVRKELAVAWATPLPYVVGALYNAVTGLLYIDQLRGREQALLQPLFPLAGFLLLLAVPVLGMRSFADERRTGSLDLLLAIPVSARSLVLGKWFATWLTALVVTAPTAAFVGFVYRFGDPDSGPLIAGYVGLALLAAVAAGLAVLASSLTSSQPVAAMVALFTVLLLWFSQAGPDALTVGSLLAHLSLSERLRSFAGGAIDSADVVFLVCLAAGALLVAGAVLRRGRRILLVVPLLALLVGGDVAADQNRRVLDLTVNDSLSLTESTKEIVGQVKADTKVSVFLQPGDPDRAAAGPLLLQYQRLNRRIKTSIKDPATAPGDVRRLGLDPAFGGVAVEQGDKIEHADTVTEQHITGALLRLLRGGRQRTVCTATGHGEAAFDDEGTSGLSEAGRILLTNGFLVRPVNLLASPSFPPECEALVLANPTAPLGDATGVVSSYLAADGRVLILADPVSDVDLNPITAPYALTLHRGVVFEGDRESTVPGDPTAPIVRRYGTSHPIPRRVPPTYFPGVQAVVVGEGRPDEGLVVSDLAETSELSYLETKPLEGEFSPTEDRGGPIVVAAAADKSRLEGEGAKRSRLVVFADVDFATNQLIGEAGNATFLLNAVEWLTTNQDELVLSANLPPYRPLSLTKAQLTYARLLAAGIIPLLFLLLGATLWALRRGR